jgi:hypothetical protein
MVSALHWFPARTSGKRLTGMSKRGNGYGGENRVYILKRVKIDKN